MSARRRASLGLLGQNAADGKPVGSIEAFEDFRRRHSRQNKDIIIENALRRTTIKGLQDEIGALHVELLEVRQANIFLQLQVTRLQTHSARVHGDPTREAIDQILAAVPALRQLRDSLGLLSPKSSPPAPSVNAWTLNSTENPTGTRPAAAAAELNDLGPLLEANEYGSETGSQVDPEERKPRRAVQARRRTDVGSVAASRSPRPQDYHPTASFIADIPSPNSPRSPASTTSPSPERVPHIQSHSPTGESKTKRRRESGLLQLRPPAAPSMVWDEGDGNIIAVDSLQQVLPGKQTKEKEQSNGKRPSAPTVKVKDMAAGLAQETPLIQSDDVANTVGKEEGVNEIIGSQRKGNKTLHPMGSVREEKSQTGSSSSSRVSSIGVADMSALTTITDDDGGRGRRARRSVNYKEPSLTKKMRKPEGITAEDTLRVNARASLSGASPASSDASTSHSTSTQPSAASRVHMSAMRRKSALPKAGQPLVRTPADDEDEDELDDCPYLASDLPEVVTPGDEDIGSDYQSTQSTSFVSSSAVPSISDSGVTPTPLPRETFQSSMTPAPTFELENFTSEPHSSPPPTRMSPRKNAGTLTKRSNETPGQMRIAPDSHSKLPNSRTTTSVSNSSSRNALKDLPTPNGQPTASGGNVKKTTTTSSTGVKKAGHRISSAA